MLIRVVESSSRTGSLCVPFPPFQTQLAPANHPEADLSCAWIQLVTSLRSSKSSGPLLAAKGGKIAVKGTVGSNASHTMNEDERSSFTAHINGVRSPLCHLLL